MKQVKFLMSIQLDVPVLRKCLYPEIQSCLKELILEKQGE